MKNTKKSTFKKHNKQTNDKQLIESALLVAHALSPWPTE